MTHSQQLVCAVAQCMDLVLRSASLKLPDDKSRSAVEFANKSAETVVQLLKAKGIVRVLADLVVNNSAVGMVLSGLRLGTALCATGQQTALVEAGLLTELRRQIEPVSTAIGDCVLRMEVINSQASLLLRLGDNALAHVPVATLVDLLSSNNIEAQVQAARAITVACAGSGTIQRVSNVAHLAVPAIVRSVNQALRRLTAYHHKSATKDASNTAADSSAGQGDLTNASKWLEVTTSCITALASFSKKKQYHRAIIKVCVVRGAAAPLLLPPARVPPCGSVIRPCARIGENPL